MAATIRQLEKIDQLVTELGLEGALKDQVYAIAKAPDASPAMGGPISELISGLIERSRARRQAARRGGAEAPAASPRGIWEDVPDGRYALDASTLVDFGIDHLIGGEADKIFVRVNTWTPDGEKPVTYVRQLKGAPGAFTKIKHPASVNVAIRDALLKVTPQAAGLLFSQHYTRCARCLSELTDARSIMTGYGPTCRSEMGLAE